MAVQLHYREGDTGKLRKKALSNSLIMRQFNRTLLAHAQAVADRGSIKCFRNTFEQESLSSIGSDEMRRRLTGRTVQSSVQVYTQNIPNDRLRRAEFLQALDASMANIAFNGVDLSRIVRPN